MTLKKVQDFLASLYRLARSFYVRYIKPRNWKRFFWTLGGIAAGCVVIAVVVVTYFIFQVPDPSILSVRHINESTKIYDRTGVTVLYDVHGEEKRTIVSWEQIPDSVKNATLATEDWGFYDHSGINLRGIARAIWHDVSSFEVAQGGSSITQQLVKKAIVGDDRTITRKIKEMILAIQIERAYSKDQIFWMYLNQIPYGSNAYGIEAASQTFFGKPAIELTLSEAATLAALPKAPSYYSPYGNHVDQLTNRQQYVLRRMKELGMITEAEYDTAIQDAPKFKEAEDRFPAAHFVIMVKEYLISKYGEELVENGGLKVITTLDKEKQDIAQELVTKYGDINEKKYKADNMSLVSIDPKTGQLLALVGSRDYFKIERKGNYNVALSNIRQPGSSFKPFAYATAFLKGYSDSTVLFDLKTEFNPTCDPSGGQSYGTGPCYHPRNYSGTFSGPVTIRQALARSLNIPAVKAFYLAGITDTIETAHSMGLASLDPQTTYGLSVVLGGTGVSLIDMVSGYGVFANDGVRNPTTFILKITTADGSILEEYQPEDERVLPSQVARMISDILSDNNARAPAFGFNNSLVLPGRPAAAKTGTTQNNRDGWLIGYTPSLVTGIWTGNNDDSPMTAAGAGASAAGPVWNEYMRRALQKTPVEYFRKPNPVIDDRPMMNGDYHGPDGEIHSILYYINQNDRMFRNWESAVQQWVTETGQQPTPSAEPTSEPGASSTPVPFVTAPPIL
ncbi:MAG: transglycosylase domain-containing protein [Patescibacteria group bacterium]